MHNTAYVSSNSSHAKSSPIPPLRFDSKFSDGIGSNHVGQLTPPRTPSSLKEAKDLRTPSTTPTVSRKSRRRSNLFQPLSNKNKHLDEKYKNGEVGSGREIPLRQGYLYKKSGKTLNKEWKKKYVTLTNDGNLTYHPSLHDYMDNVHGKHIPLKHTTVKIPGSKPRGSRVPHETNAQSSDISHDLINLKIKGKDNDVDKRFISSTSPRPDSGSHKKKHRRLKSSSKNEADESDGYEFTIVSLENKQWHFEASNTNDREAWVTAIEQQILTSLQGLESEKSKYSNSPCVDAVAIQAIRTVSGNNFCVDCNSPNPDWASLNLGALMCIECSGIHRNLGTHISKVRSLHLDDWPPGHISVMMALGNSVVNGIWEARVNDRMKPTPNTSRKEKELWIRSKYENKEFLRPLPALTRVEQQIFDAVLKSDSKLLALILANVPSHEHLNLSFYNLDIKTPLHIASANGCLAIVQMLLWQNGNLKATDAEGKTALFYSRINGHKEIEQLLMQNGCLETSGFRTALNRFASFDVNNTLSKRRGSLQTLTVKSSEIFDKLPASIV